MQLVRTCVLAKYHQHDRRKRRLPDRPATYLTDLEKPIKKEGLKQPIILAVSKIAERVYVYKGNHRMAVLLNEDVLWVPLKVNYFFLNDDHDKKFNFIPRLVNGNWLTVLKPSVLGFETRPIWLTKRQRQLENNFWVECMLTEFFCCTYLYVHYYPVFKSSSDLRPWA